MKTALLEILEDEQGHVRYVRYSKWYVLNKFKTATEDKRERLMMCKVTEDETSITFDKKHPSWKALEREKKGLKAHVYKGEWTEAAKRVSHGIWGLTKSVLKINRAAEQIIAARTDICEKCDENVPCWKGSSARCCGQLINVLKPGKGTCGCKINNKVSVATESCPLNKW